MVRNARFRPGLREQRTQVARLLQHMAAAAPEEKRERALAMANETMASIPQKRERAAPRALEAPVVAAISQLLAVHPRVIWAARFNSGAASYEAASGRYAPVWFHRFVRVPSGTKIRMPDFFGLYELSLDYTSYAGARPIAIEAKPHGWTKPRDEREREQAAFLKMIREVGGIGIFATSAQDVAEALA